MDQVLLHCCCAPCSVYCIDSLREEGIEPTALWYNPNIHPYQEYVARRDTLRTYAPSIGMTLHVIEEYGLREFVRNVADDIDHRCGYCYRIRMEKAAEFASGHGFEAFTSTLLVSPYQNHEGIVAAAEAAADKFGVQFLYRDFRPGFREGQVKARELGFYMQKYCVFSEEDRYRKQILRDLQRNEV